MSLLSKNTSLRIEVPQISIGLQWDILNKSTDLDASCVMYNSFGKIQDAVYYNKLKSECGGIVHSGDNKTGEGFGDDEVIDVDFGLVQLDVEVMMITVCCHSGSFDDVETAKVVVRDFGGTEYCNFQIGRYSGYTSIVLCVLFKDHEGFWNIKNTEIPSNGRNFQHMAPVMRDILIEYIDEGMMLEGMHIEGKSFEMEKGDIFDIPDVSRVTVGLGWDFVGSSVDLDASVILFDKNAEVKEIVYFGNLVSSHGGIVHHGDNTTGKGDGDDEVIDINFDKISSSICTLVVTVNIYSTGKTFSKVTNPFIRLVAHNQEICRYNLGTECGNNSGLILAKFYRKSVTSNEWMIIAVGEPASGRRGEDTVPKIMELGLIKDFALEEKMRKPYKVCFNIEEGRDLVAKDSNGFSDPYVKYKVSGIKGKSQKIKKTLNPAWNFPSEPLSVTGCDTTQDLPSIVLRLDVYDHDVIGKDDFMGTCEVNLTDVINGQLNTEIDVWVPLVPRPGKNDRVSGEVKITAICYNKTTYRQMNTDVRGWKWTLPQ